MNYLVVVAHPDDEVLGVGTTTNKFAKKGNKAAVAIMSGLAATRTNISAILSEGEAKTMNMLGVGKVYHADFPNIKINTIPHIYLVQYIEKCIMDWQAEAIITHHLSDANIDHQETSRAVNTAIRPFQRTDGMPKLRKLMYMEVPSSTEWSLNPAENRYIPNLFMEIGDSGEKVKMEVLAAYKDVMRPFTHPRSKKAIEGFAAYRCIQAGSDYAEVFKLCSGQNKRGSSTYV